MTPSQGTCWQMPASIDAGGGPPQAFLPPAPPWPLPPDPGVPPVALPPPVPPLPLVLLQPRGNAPAARSTRAPSQLTCFTSFISFSGFRLG